MIRWAIAAAGIAGFAAAILMLASAALQPLCHIYDGSWSSQLAAALQTAPYAFAHSAREHPRPLLLQPTGHSNQLLHNSVSMGKVLSWCLVSVLVQEVQCSSAKSVGCHAVPAELSSFPEVRFVGSVAHMGHRTITCHLHSASPAGTARQKSSTSLHTRGFLRLSSHSASTCHSARTPLPPENPAALQYMSLV